MMTVRRPWVFANFCLSSLCTWKVGKKTIPMVTAHMVTAFPKFAFFKNFLEAPPENIFKLET